MLLHISGCLAVLLQLSHAFPSEHKETYTGHKVVELTPKTDFNYGKVRQMETQYDLDVWKSPKHANDSMTVRVHPYHMDNFLQEIKTLDITTQILIDDVEKLIEDIELRNRQDQALHKRQIFNFGSGFNHDVYHDFSEIMNFLRVVEADTNKADGITAELMTIGHSTEGREITLIKISSDQGSNKRGIFIDGGIHAREWVAPASVCFMIEELAYNPDSHPDVDILLGHFDIYLVPVLNPDGYQYSRDSTRLWRKNRRSNSGSSCVGVDLNRNFPFEWNPAVGGSTNPCASTYSGANAASEQETQVLVNFLTNNGNEFDAYLTIHSYGQYWLYPWGYTSDYPSDRVDLDDCGYQAVKAIREWNNGGTVYELGSSTNVLYSAAGGSDDYAKGGAGIKYSYTLELPDTGNYGFLLPESLIRPSCEELREGIYAFASAMYTREGGALLGK